MRIRLRHAAARTAVVSLCLLLCTPIAPAAGASAVSSDRYAAIDAYIQDRMNTTRTPGLSYAVVGPDGPVHRRSWGVDGHGERVTANTPFLWGSVAKPVTATSVMILVQEGRLRLEDRVVEHLPDFGFGGAAHASKVTVRHLLNQTAGIPEAAALKVTDCLAADCPRPVERIGDLDGVRPLGPPGAEYAYSSANYLILSALVESVTGRSFSEHLRQSVLAPARMDGAIADQESARDRNLPPGHQLLWGVPAAIAEGVDDHGAGYGYLGGDLHDLAAFASLQLRYGRTDKGDTVLTPEFVRLMREEGRLQPGGTGAGYGLGWRVGGLAAPLDEALWHTGGTPGYSAMLFLLPERNIALVLQQNLYGLLQDKAVMQIGFGAARILADGRTPTGGDSASTYYWSVWGATALAALLVLSAGRSVLLLRRPAVPGLPLRCTAVAALWCVVGALPWVVLVQVGDRMGLGQLRNWVPDGFIAVCVAAAAGAATVVLRLVLAIRAARVDS
ncbi:serine hydrolase domain-containing protein [Streptomyces sp. BB1-1-1]|uniref:serine hydrolase domain-containing protein n=1 Tax=Streptomyces sp. BB1-1-1 TaxID=3074430 RepID=UPI0028776D2E|nr:serine hydrolase domain-containing protein [Streptomyces sp. BB1-1-1]WND34997.1 serine hydrolase domain-containing protein [Streptomyces sp. BB1-1-1]